MGKFDYLMDDITSMMELDLDWTNMTGKTVLVTGATGLLGSMSCRALSILDKQNGWGLKILAVVRSANRCKEMLTDVMVNGNIEFIEQDVAMPICYEGAVDYIIHSACPTKSSFFVNNPVETISAIVDGTKNILELAKAKNTESVIYLSSMEVYGQILHENFLHEEDVGYVNPLSLRSCYPEGKKLAEALCISYASEYQIPVKVIRLAQTFGPGIPADDNRVFAQFLHSALEGKNIVMFTEGGSKRMCLDTMDAISAIFMILLKGENGCVYNAANEANYCSIKEMAQLVIAEFSQGKSELVIDRSKDVGQYPPDNMLRLDVSKLKALGWEAKYTLKDMYQRMVNELQSNE